MEAQQKNSKPAKKKGGMAAMMARKQKDKPKNPADAAQEEQKEKNEQPTDEVVGGPAQQQESESPIDTKARPHAPSDDEEEEDDSVANTGGSMWLKDIKEGKEASTTNVVQDAKLDPYGLDQSKGGAAGDAAKPKDAPKKDASKITFGGGPRKFTNRNKPQNKLGAADEFGGLDELDDEGNSKSKKNEKKATVAADESKAEEVKQEEPQRPRFRGKLNLTKTGDGGDDNAANKAASTNYGFTVKYKSDHPPKPEEGKEGAAAAEKGESPGQKPDTRKDKRNTGNRGQPFGGFKKQFNNDGFDDDGFEVVTDKQKDRRKRNFKKQDSDDSGDEGFTITRGDRGERGGRGRGRGGFERGGFERGEKKVADNA